MFLWAYLMVKELKELGTVNQVNDALKCLPTGLEEIHETIITRLDSTLRTGHRDLAIKILTWVVCAVRPLRLAELQEILRFEIRQGRAADHAFTDDDDLLYSEQDIELACGALVLCRNETLQLIHLSTKEILIRKPNHMPSPDSRVAFYVDAQRENPKFPILCASYISTHLEGIRSITQPELETVLRLPFHKGSFGPTKLIMSSPFMDYASLSWQTHLIDGEISLELDDIMRQLGALLTYDFTILWIELCVSLHSDITWTLERSCKEIISWADYTLVPTASSCHETIGFLWAWSNAVVLIINEYGRFIEEHPLEINLLDLEHMLSYALAPSPAVLPLPRLQKPHPHPPPPNIPRCEFCKRVPHGVDGVLDVFDAADYFCFARGGEEGAVGCYCEGEGGVRGGCGRGLGARGGELWSWGGGGRCLGGG